MSLLLQNLSDACRILQRQPSFSSVAILTLALGIGATTAVFTVVYGVLLRPLPYRDPGRLVMLLYGHQGTVSPWFSPPNFRDYVARNDAFVGTTALAPITVNLTGLGEPERLQGARVAWNYFDVLGVPSLRRDVAGVDPLLPLANITSLASLVDLSIVGRRFTMVLFLSFAVIAAVLSAIGVYSVLAYLVSQRTKEIGLRLAIGALPSAVVWLFVREGLVLTAVALTAGFAGAVAADQWIRALLFGVTPADPTTFAAVGCALTVTAVLATYVPARRAARVDPTDALRTD